MQNQEENKPHRGGTHTNNDDNNQPTRNERFGLWFGLGVATVATVSVLALSFFTAYKAQNPDDANAEVQAASITTMGSIPSSESEAANIATLTSDSQINGMTAPADNGEEEASAPAASSPAAAILGNDDAATTDSAKVIVENGVVKFYFSSGKSDLAADANIALKDVLAGVQAGKKAVVSGYADSTGNIAQNEQLSKTRAFKVRDALLAAGVPESSIVMEKPQNSTGTGAQDEARRVEVMLR